MTVGIIANTELKNLLSEKLPDWQTDSGVIERSFSTTGWKSSLMVVNAIGYLAEASWHHPDIEVSYDTVKVILTTHSEGGVTEKDIELAKKIDELLGWLPQDGALKHPPQRFSMISADHQPEK